MRLPGDAVRGPAMPCGDCKQTDGVCAKCSHDIEQAYKRNEERKKMPGNGELQLEDFIPSRARRTGSQRRNVSMRPETLTRLEHVAQGLNVSLADAIETMMAYLDDQGVVELPEVDDV